MRGRIIAAITAAAALAWCLPDALAIPKVYLTSNAFYSYYDEDYDDDEEDYDFYMDEPVFEEVRHLSDRTQLTLVWKAVDEATGYQIQYTQNGKYTKAHTINTDENRSATIRGLKKGKDCKIRIRACNDEYGVRTCSGWTVIKVSTTEKGHSSKTGNK